MDNTQRHCKSQGLEPRRIEAHLKLGIRESHGIDAVDLGKGLQLPLDAVRLHPQALVVGLADDGNGSRRVG
jgi:hypothetical protein